MSVKSIVRAGVFAALIAVVTIMFRYVQPFLVPFSLQPVVVMLAGCLLAPAEALLALTIYILIGLMGVPVFSSPPYAGIAYLLKPSFGFLIGFIPAAGLMSWFLRHRRRNFGMLLTVCVGGIVVYYLVGLPYLYAVLTYYLHQPAGLLKVLEIGLLPFIGFDLLKAVLAAWLAREISRRLQPDQIES